MNFSFLAFKGFFWTGAFFLLFASCKQEPSKSKPSDYFTTGQEKELLMQLDKRVGEKPDLTLSSPEQDAWYQEMAKTYQWHFVHESPEGFYYLISRPAPSLYGKRAALGGWFSSKDHLTIQNYREIFHTFKMKPEDLLKKSAVLFEKMVNREDLSSYYPNRNKENEEWIEFPDELNYYDTAAHAWKMRIPQNP
jgi:hypothetical protein